VSLGSDDLFMLITTVLFSNASEIYARSLTSASVKVFFSVYCGGVLACEVYYYNRTSVTNELMTSTTNVRMRFS
jgi:hypothetical protein